MHKLKKEKNQQNPTTLMISRAYINPPPHLLYKK